MQNNGLRKKFFIFIAKLVVSAFLVLFIVKTVKITNFSQIFRAVSVSVYLYSFVVFLMSFLLLSLKWWVLVKNLKVVEALRHSFIGYYYSLIIPGQIAGDGVKAVRLDRTHSCATNPYIVLLLDKILGFLCICIFAVVGLLITDQQYPVYTTFLFLLFSLLFIAVLFMLLRKDVFFWFLEKIQVVVLHFFKFKIPYPQGLLLRKYPTAKSIVISFTLGIFAQFLSAYSTFVLSRYLGVSIPFIDWFIIIGILNFVLLLPLTVAGIGLRDGTLVVIFGLYHVEPGLALTISLIGLSYQLILGFFGFLLEISRRKNVKQLNA